MSDAAPVAAAPGVATRTLHVLVVDDSETELHLMSQLLGSAGHRVSRARDGQEALAQLEAHRPDLILMDVVMPGSNGFQLTRTITRDPRWQGLPVFICSSKKLETDKVWAMRQGARAYFVKPVDKAELLARIAALAGELPGAADEGGAAR